MIGIFGVVFLLVFLIVYFPIQKQLKERYNIYSLTKNYPQKKGLISLLLNIVPPTFVAVSFILIMGDSTTNNITIAILYLVITCLIFGFLYLFY